MDIHNLSIKFFTNESPAVSLTALIPLFHQWIREKSVDGMLIDVADYKHVPQGPGMMLIGHDCDYAMDMTSDLPGLLYRHKRDLSGDAAARVKLLLGRALRACHLIQEAGLATFDTSRFELVIYDRLQAPNTPESFAQLQPLFHELLAPYFGQGLNSSVLHSDPRSLFGLSLKATQQQDVTALLSSVG